MKELTIEQKAQRYDEAIERAKEMIKSMTNIGGVAKIDDIQHIFPEFIESDENIREELIDFVKSRLAGFPQCNKYLAWLEKQNEQKPADIEPKFKVGDWVFIEEVKGHKNGPFQIKVIDSFGYGFDEYHTIPFMYEELLSKWTIQDAKDGDVVVDKSDGAIGIFQSIGHYPDGGSYNDPSYCFLHCRYDDGFFYADFEHGNTIDSDDLIPASKEQRDLLFQKMKEVGYEWDADKKELKKIIDEKQIKKNLQDNHFRRMFEQESAEWSEEDERIIDTIIYDLERHGGKEDSCYSEEISWLKSLKDRYTWKPSDEQMKYLHQIVTECEETSIAGNLYLESLYNDLKKLKE